MRVIDSVLNMYSVQLCAALRFSLLISFYAGPRTKGAAYFVLAYIVNLSSLPLTVGVYLLYRSLFTFGLLVLLVRSFKRTALF